MILNWSVFYSNEVDEHFSYGWQLVGGGGKGQHDVKMPNSALLFGVSSGILLLCVFDCFIIISSSLKSVSKRWRKIGRFTRLEKCQVEISVQVLERIKALDSTLALT